MKKKFAAIALVITMLFCSIMPVAAGSRLRQPEIEEIETGKNSIKIDWDYNGKADEYNVYRSTSKNGPFKYIASTDESWYRDYDIKKGTRYYYKVKSISFGEYDDSKMSLWRSAKVKKPKVTTSSSSPSYSQTVYITATGSKYHQSWCGYLWNSSYAISLSNAKSQGYTACSRCF